MNTNNGFVSLRGMDIPNPNESKRRRYVWIKRIFPRRIKWTILLAGASLMMVWAFYCIITKEPQPVLWINANEVVQAVELPDGTIIDKQDPRVWDYINRGGYETRYKSR